ncbi:hypothetical protein GOBAR_DD09534 [Gossypium barbadense]|nr:hypothetical protein GOBAR_DD09534 [Gossypium barbadense]
MPCCVEGFFSGHFPMEGTTRQRHITLLGLTRNLKGIFEGASSQVGELGIASWEVKLESAEQGNGNLQISYLANWQVGEDGELGAKWRASEVVDIGMANCGRRRGKSWPSNGQRMESRGRRVRRVVAIRRIGDGELF